MQMNLEELTISPKSAAGTQLNTKNKNRAGGAIENTIFYLLRPRRR